MSVKKSLIVIFAFFLLAFGLVARPGFCATNRMADYLCELGIKFYKVGRIDEALIEFRKVLLVDPNNKTAKEYMDRILQKTPPAEPPAAKTPKPKTKKQPPLVKAAPREAVISPAPPERKAISVEAKGKSKPLTLTSLQQIIAEAKKNVEIIDQKMQRQQARAPKPSLPKPTREELRKVALEKKERQLELKREQAMERQLEQAQGKKSN